MRMKELTENIPKPLAIVGGRPILWHIMKIYSRYGFDEFILPLGYKGDKIKEYFINCDWMHSDFVLELGSSMDRMLLNNQPENWRITFVDTGIDTMTGGRLKRIQPYVGDETFLMTYGDGVCDVDIGGLVEYHKRMGVTATLTGIRKRSQYGLLSVCEGLAASFSEKSETEGLINGGFFVLNKEVFKYLTDDGCVFEKETLSQLASEGQLAVYQHKGLWRSIDTCKDLQQLNSEWGSIKAVLNI